jgi:hypothetical protein
MNKICRSCRFWEANEGHLTGECVHLFVAPGKESQDADVLVVNRPLADDDLHLETWCDFGCRLWRAKEKKCSAKMVMRLARREAKAHRLLAHYVSAYDTLKDEYGGVIDEWPPSWKGEVEAFLKDGMVDASD